MKSFEPIALVGMACRFPDAPDLQTFWQNLCQAHDAVRPVPESRGLGAAFQAGLIEDIDLFDAAFFGISPAEARHMDPQQRLLMMLSWECLEDAGLKPEKLQQQAVGVFIGLSSADYVQTQLMSAEQVDMYTITGAAASVSANRLSYFYDFRGPSLMVDTACSSSLTAVHLACESLQNGESRLALAGGANLLLSPLIQQGFAEAMSLSALGRCQAFAAGADGMVRGEGAGLILLKPLKQALQDGDRIYSVIRGSAIGQDGLTNGLSAPSPAGQRAVLQQAYARSQVAPHEVVFVEAHGTGTPLGDPIEAKALADVLGKDRPPQQALRLGSVKSNLGHLEAAAGIAGLIKASLALYHRHLPQTLHAAEPNPRIPFAQWGLQIQQNASDLPQKSLAGVSAFGFGGTNVHIVLESAETAPDLNPATRPDSSDSSVSPPTLLPSLLPLCARSARSLQHNAHKLAETIAAADPAPAAFAAHWALRRQSALTQTYRQACVLPADADNAAIKLRNLPEATARPKQRPQIAFLFSGTGSQSIAMGRQLMHLEVFRTRLAEVDQAIKAYVSESLFDLLPQDIHDPDLIQWMLFGIQLALAAQWQAWGIQPDAVVGASFAEVAAAVTAGIYDLNQAVAVLHQRIEKVASQIGTGRVAVVGLSAAEIEPHLQDKPLWLASINGPAMCAVSGQADALDHLIQDLQAQGIFVRDVRGATAPSHTPMMQVVQQDLLSGLQNLSPGTGSLDFWSTVDAQKRAGSTLDGNYWYRNISESVKLYPTILNMLAGQDWVILEISPHPIAIGSLSAHIETQHVLHLLGSLRKDQTDLSPMLESLGRLYELGFEINWQALYPELPPLDLPTYQWDLDSYWMEPPQSRASSAQAVGIYRPQPGRKSVSGPQQSTFDREQLLLLPATQQHAALALHLQAHIARALHLAPQDLALDQPLKHLGIGSLVGMELYQTLKKQWQVELALSDVLKGPSLDQLAHLILQSLAPHAPAETSASLRPELLPLSFAQQGFWFFEQLQPDSLSYHIPGVIELNGQIDLSKLKAALQGLIDRHEILRTVYLSDAHGQPYQKILNPCQLQFEQIDWVESEQALAALAQKPFQLDSLPPFRVTLMSEAATETCPQRHRLLIDMHHLVADGYSFKLMLQDLRALYLGHELEPSSQYADFALWQREQSQSASYQKHLDYWLNKLADAPDYLPLPGDFHREAQTRARGQRWRFVVPASLQSKLEELSRQQGVSLYTLLLGAYCVLLHRLSQADDLVIGTPVLGRSESLWLNGVGPYLNMLPIRAQVSGQMRCEDFWHVLQAVILEGFDHQDLPFEQLVEALNPQRELAWHPVYQHVFALHAPLEAQDWEDIQLNLLDLDLGVARFDLAMTLHPIENPDSKTPLGLQGNIEFNTALFRSESIQAMAYAYVCILEQWADAPQHQPLGQIQLSHKPLEPILIGPQYDPPEWRLGPRLIALSQAQAESLALKQEVYSESGSEFKQFSYAQLMRHACALASHLQVQKIQRVAIVLPRSIEMILSWVGALLGGATLIPLDPDQPQARLQALVKDACAELVITAFAETDWPCQTLNANRLLQLEPAPEQFCPQEAEICYQIYTSGSTGKPKGVCVSQDSLLSLISWHHQRYPLPVGTAVTQIANPAFDAAIWEIWTALSAGLCLHLPASQSIQDPERLRHYWQHQQIQLSFVPTPLWHRVQSSSGPEITLRYVLSGGDRLQSYPPPEARYEVHNHYGPTENTVVTTVCQIMPQQDPQQAPAIGWPLPGHELYVLDAQGRALPAGLSGELWISGPALAQGYWSAQHHGIQPDHPSFVQSEVNGQLKVLYRTGDRVYVSEQGLHFIGRDDQQIKIRGVRIEIREIAQVILQSPFKIQACEVISEEQQLVAFVCTELPAFDAHSLRLYLSEHLPAVMLPQHIESLPELPLTSRGKVDAQTLKQLAAQILRQRPLSHYVSDSALQNELALIWQALLPGVAIQADSDFFALGGHSLMALDLRHQIQQRLGLDLPLSQLFKYRNLSQLADYLQNKAPQAPWPELVIAADQHFEAFELNDMQQAYWIGRQSTDQAAVSAHAYLEIDFEQLDLDRLEQVLRQLIEIHPMLRCVIDSQGQQRVLNQVPSYTITCTDLRTSPDPSYLEHIRQQLSHEVRPAEQWPLFGIQATLLPTFTRLHLSIDALICDATSLMLLAQQLETLYRDPQTAIKCPELHFRDALLYEHGLSTSGLYARHRQYWQERIAELPLAPQLPIKQPLTQIQNLRFGRQSSRMAADDWLQLKQATAQWGVTPSCLLLSVFGQVLANWQDDQPLSLNLTTFARLPVHPEMPEIVGDFTRLSLLAFEPQPDDFVQQTRNLQARLMADLDHGLYHGIQVMRDLRQQRGAEAAQMPVVFTSMLGHADQPAPFESLGGKLAYSQTQTPQVWLDHQVSEPAGELRYDWDYPLDLFPEGLIEALFAAYQQALAQLLEIVSETQAGTPWNGGLKTRPALQSDQSATQIPVQTLHTAFMSQVQKTPTALAIIDPEISLSYAQLWHLARQTARIIAPFVTKADTPIAICLPGGWRQSVAVLAVLMAGGTYLPLNPDWPTRRLQSLLERTLSPALICQPGQATLLDFGGEIIDLTLPTQDELIQLASQVIDLHVLTGFYQAQPSDLAYIIFTSGSTGEPKGVMMEHQAVWNTIEDVNQRLQLTASDRVLAISDLNFDLSVWDLFGPLSVGAALVYPEAHQNRDPAHWLKLCQEHHISIWNSVPALMAMMTTYAAGQPERHLPDLRAVMLSGDWIPLTLPDEIRTQLNIQSRVISMGGATEAAIWSIWYEVHELAADWKSIPYGKGLRHQDIIVLNSRLEPCPIWAAGDLYISGYGLARGYFGDTEQSAYRFIKHPLTGQSLYRTGDRGRLRADGQLEFLGRQDLQVKIQGYRIELSEIESVLQAHPELAQVMVLALGPQQGPRYLVGCLQAKPSLSEASLTADVLSAWLGERLPAYMIPVRWLWKPAPWPLNATGKLDRKALQTWVEAQLDTHLDAQPLSKSVEFRSHQTEDPALAYWQAALADLLQSSLHLPELLPDQDFLSLGVNSIDLVRVGNLLEERYGMTPGMGEMFSLRNLKALAQWYAQQAPGTNVLTPPTQSTALPEHTTALQGTGESHYPTLIPLPPDSDLKPETFELWHSQREFGSQSLTIEQLSRLLAVLRQLDVAGQAKRLYPSAGGVYAIDCYLQLRPEAFSDLPAGMYHYDSANHSLKLIRTGDHWPQDLHLPVAQAMAAASRFSLYLVLDLARMQAKYGPDARDYGLIEAGAMSQLLRQQAADCQIGLCAIGRVNPQHVSIFFELSPEQILLHSLIGGPLPQAEQEEEYEEWVI